MLSISIVDAGRALLGVPDGVPLGVDCVLLVPTRDFLDDDRGVILLLRKAFTGVDKSSLAPVFAFGVLPVSLRSGRRGWGVFVGVAEAASLGVMGDFTVLFDARVGISGRPLLALYLSVGILRCLVVV